MYVWQCVTFWDILYLSGPIAPDFRAMGRPARAYAMIIALKFGESRGLNREAVNQHQLSHYG